MRSCGGKTFRPKLTVNNLRLACESSAAKLEKEEKRKLGEKKRKNRTKYKKGKKAKAVKKARAH